MRGRIPVLPLPARRLLPCRQGQLPIPVPFGPLTYLSIQYLLTNIPGSHRRIADRNDGSLRVTHKDFCSTPARTPAGPAHHEEPDVKGKDNSSETLSKGLRILDIFGVEDTGFTLSQISVRVGLNKTSVYRYVNTFREQGYLRRDERTGLYHLGVRALSLAHAIMEKSEMARQVRPFVEEAYRRHGVHVDVGMLSGDAIYLVCRLESKDTSVFRSFTYSSQPHFLATGKAAMAFMEPGALTLMLERLTLTAKTEKSMTEPGALRTDLERTRERGYSVNDEEFVPGLIAVGAPLFSLRTGKVVGGVSFDSTTDQYSIKDFEANFSGYLVELAKKISAVVTL